MSSGRAIALGARTRLLGVIGWPVDHSRSPEMQNAALQELGLDCCYLAFAVSPSSLTQAIAGASALGMLGLNVTIPHKEKSLMCCRPDALALEVGAVNTLLFTDGEVVGTNTDVYGFGQLLDESGASRNGHVVVLGAGGAARAVAATLGPTAQSLTLLGRRERAVQVGSRRFQVVGDDPSSRAKFLAGADLLVDATPRGLDDGAEAVDLSPLPSGAVVLDLAVRRETALVRAARARGLRAATGECMLLHQGARSLELWTGQPAPVQVMRAALARSLDRQR